MPDPLAPVSPLGGFSRDFAGARLREPEDLAIVALALPLGEEAAALAAIGAGFSAAPPAVGRSALSADGAFRLLRLGQDQLFVLFQRPTPDAEAVVARKIGAAAWITDQTDVWAALELSGPLARAALARICPLDLDPRAFGPDAVARTIMEHLGTIVARTGEDAFLLLSASSSARSFLHAVETSIEYVQ